MLSVVYLWAHWVLIGLYLRALIIQFIPRLLCNCTLVHRLLAYEVSLFVWFVNSLTLEWYTVSWSCSFIHSHECAFILLRFINSLDLVGIHAYYSNSLTLACVFILLKFINSHVCVYITWIHYILFPGIRFILIWPLYDILALKVIITNVSLGLNKACAIICLSYDWRCKTSEMTKINENGLCYHDRYFGIRGPSDQFRPRLPSWLLTMGLASHDVRAHVVYRRFKLWKGMVRFITKWVHTTLY